MSETPLEGMFREFGIPSEKGYIIRRKDSPPSTESAGLSCRAEDFERKNETGCHGSYQSTTHQKDEDERPLRINKQLSG